jgi:hypothetical protein
MGVGIGDVQQKWLILVSAQIPQNAALQKLKKIPISLNSVISHIEDIEVMELQLTLEAANKCI